MLKELPTAPEVPAAGLSPVTPKQTWAEELGPELSKKSMKASRRDDLVLASVTHSRSASLDDLAEDATEKSYLNSSDADPSQTYLTSTPNKAGVGKLQRQRSPPKVESLNHSWASSKKEESQPAATKAVSGKLLLHPITPEVPVSAPKDTWAPDTRKETLNNSSGKQTAANTKKTKVPPIKPDKSQSPLPANSVEEPEQTDESDFPQSDANLNKVRNSATKKKADKLFEKIERKQQNEALNNSLGSPNKVTIRNGRESPTETQAKTSKQSAEKNAKVVEAGLRLIKTDSQNKLVNPNTQIKLEADIMVAVGIGYNEDAMEAPPRAALIPTSKIKAEKPKAKPVNALSPLGIASSSGPGMVPLHDDQENVSIVGKGVFEDKGDAHVTAKPRSERSTSIRKPIEPHSEPATLVSKPLNALPLDELSGELADSDEEMSSLQVSQAVRDNVARKRQQKQEESARRRAMKEAEEEQRRAEEEKRHADQAVAVERRRKEQEAAAEKRRRHLEKQQQRSEELNNNSFVAEPSLAIAGSSPSKPPSGKALSLTQRQSPPPSSAGSSFIGDDTLRPFSKPDAALKVALKLISQDDWSQKCEGINRIRRLATHHGDVITVPLHAVTVAVLNEVKNLRTQVARLAIIALGDLFNFLGKAMDSELDACAKILLHKNGEANEFIRSELDRALSFMVEETTPQRAIVAVINGGASHKNPAVRAVSGQHMITLCEKIGPARLLTGIKDTSDKLLPALNTLSVDPSPETRWNAKKILLMLSNHPEFDSALSRHLSAKDARNMKEVADTLKAKGLGEAPGESPSAKGSRRSGTLNRSRTGSADTLDPPQAVGLKRRTLLGMADEEAVKELLDSMASNSWDRRHDSIDEFVEMVENRPHIISAQTVKILDRFLPLLKDNNSKVCVHALESLCKVLPQVVEVLGSSVNLLIQNTASSLASKNKEIKEAASELLDAYINNIDHVMLLQPYVQVALNCTAKVKPDIVDRVAYLCQKVYPRKPKAVHLHVLPLAWNLVTSSAATAASGPLRDATRDLIKSLNQLIGPAAFLDHATSAPASNQKLIDSIKEMLDQS